MEHDLDMLPLLVESHDTIEALHAAVCAPLTVGDEVVGLLWVSRKRVDEDWSYEDVEFLASFARHVASTLWAARQAELLAEARQLESLNRLSSFVLHDIKNQVSGLSLVVENARRHLGNPEFQRDAMAVVERTVASLRELMNHVSGVARTLDVRPEPCTGREIVESAIADSGLVAGEAQGVRLSVHVKDGGEIFVDRRLVTRVLVNLLVNAREATEGRGHVEVEAGLRPGEGRAAVRAARAGRRPGHGRGVRAHEVVPPLCHDQEKRARHWTRPVPDHRPGARRTHRREQPSGRRHDFHGPSARPTGSGRAHGTRGRRRDG